MEFLQVIKSLVIDPDQAKDFNLIAFFDKNSEFIKNNVSMLNLTDYTESVTHRGHKNCACGGTLELIRSLGFSPYPTIARRSP